MENKAVQYSTAPILVIANKIDVKGAIKPKEVKDILELDKIKSRKWNIHECNAKDGYGVKPSMEWLLTLLKKKHNI